MPLTTRKGSKGREVLVRFIKDTCYEGTDYGPNHSDAPVWVPIPFARLHVDHLGRAVYVEEGDDGADTLPFDPTEVSLDHLVDVLAEIEDAEVVNALASGDERKGAVEIYAARLTELEE